MCGYEAHRTEKGEVHLWLEERWVNRLHALVIAILFIFLVIVPFWSSSLSV
jgi:hypothetical protein